MRKRVIAPPPPDISLPTDNWLDVEDLAEVELTSEDAAHPIESALVPGEGSGWQAAASGKQTLRLLFAKPQRLRRIWLRFAERAAARTQELALRWSPDGGQSFREIVRQQWNFSPQGTTEETEDYHVDLSGVTVLELEIVPHISGGDSRASLAQWWLA